MFSFSLFCDFLSFRHFAWKSGTDLLPLSYVLSKEVANLLLLGTGSDPAQFYWQLDIDEALPCRASSI